MTVPYVDLARENAPVHDSMMAAVERVMRSGSYVLGAEVEAFEAEFAACCGVRHAVGVANGTDALMLALRAIGVGPGDEVITAPNSFVASAACIALVGATPVFADVGADMNLDPAAVAAVVTPRTKAIIAVHLTGRPAPMDELGAVAERHGLKIVEDAAQAAGARYRGRRVGGLGTIAAFSLHPNKTLGACGDGGVVVTDDDDLRAWLLRARNHGLGAGGAAFWSVNSRLDPLQAALLRPKLALLDAWNQRRRAIAARYRAALATLVTVPEDAPHEEAVYHTYIIQTPHRDALQRHLAERGIETRVHYNQPIHRQPAAAGVACGPLPMTERLAGAILSLPLFTAMRDDEVEAVIAGIRSFTP